MRVRTYGDPAKFIENILEPKRRELEAKMREALGAAYELLESAYRDILNKGRARLSEQYMAAEDRLRSAQATKEAELRLTASRVKNEWISRVLEEVKRRLAGIKGTETYAKFLARVFDAFLRESSGFERLIVAAPKDDLEILKRLAEERGKTRPELTFEESDKPILGGFIAYTPDRRVSLNYTLDLMISSAETELRSLIERRLFGG